jgi:hypothetical protein
LNAAATNVPVTYLMAADGRAYSAAGIVGTLSADTSISIPASFVMDIVLSKFSPKAAGATVLPRELAPAMQPSEGDL